MTYKNRVNITVDCHILRRKISQMVVACKGQSNLHGPNIFDNLKVLWELVWFWLEFTNFVLPHISPPENCV